MAIPEQDEAQGHFVYLYRDDRGKALYVGYGKGSARATSHLSGSHNADLSAYLKDNKTFTHEITGPLGSEAMGRAVESALISTLKPRFNRVPGSRVGRFRPIGVPEGLVERLTDEPPLTRSDFVRLHDRTCPGPVLFVIVSDRDFEDRPGYDLARIPKDRQILERMEKWWQIGRYVERWAEDPSQSPVLLVGLSGRPESRIVIGAVAIDRSGWKDAEHDGGLFRVPVVKKPTLDERGLRGRRISTEANLRFGGITTQFFVILACDGTTRGGRSATQ